MAKVRDYMTEKVVTADRGTTVAEAARIMHEHRIGCLLVMDGEVAAGVFTERDILRAVAGRDDSPRSLVGEWMTGDPVTIAPDAPTLDAIRLMMERHFRHIPVWDGERVVGILSMRDLMSLEPARRSSD